MMLTMTMTVMFTRVEFGQGSVTTVVCRRHRAFEDRAEEICLAGQLASLLYSSTKIASSSTLGHNKPEILSGIQSRRRNNLAISCILSSTFLPTLMSIIHFTLFLYIVQFSMEVTFTSKRDQLQKTLWTNSGLSPQ